MEKSNGKSWATAGFSVGVVASLAANVAHTFVGSSPAPGAVVASAFWPVALLIAMEVIARVSWPVGRSWWLVRYCGLTVVAAIAAVISYRHMAGLLISYNEDWLSAGIGPLAVDGLMLVSSAALLALNVVDIEPVLPLPGRLRRDHLGVSSAVASGVSLPEQQTASSTQLRGRTPRGKGLS